VNPIDKIARAARDPETVAPRNGYKEPHDNWTARVIGYLLTDDDVVANAARAIEAETETLGLSLEERTHIARTVLRSVGGAR
jgi:hypothetical protein